MTSRISTEKVLKMVLLQIKRKLRKLHTGIDLVTNPAKIHGILEEEVYYK